MEQAKSPWIRGIIHVALILWAIYSIFPFIMSLLTSNMVVRDVIARDPKFMPQPLVDNNVLIAILLGLVIIGVYYVMAQMQARSPYKPGEVRSAQPINPGSLGVLGVMVVVVCGGFLLITSNAGEDQIFQPTMQAYQELWLRNDAAIEAFGSIGNGLLLLIVVLVGLGLFATFSPNSKITRYIALVMIVGGTFFAAYDPITATLGFSFASETLIPTIVALALGGLVFFILWQMDNGTTAIYLAIVFVIITVIIGLPQFVRFGKFYESFLNTVIVTVSTVTVSISIGCLAAYALARYSGITGFLILLTALGFRALPRLAFILPYYYFANITGLFDTHILLIITFVTINQPFTIWMLRSFFMEIPKEIEESAMIDGCNRFTAFTRVIIPIVWPGIITTALFSMLLAYNEFLLASLLTSTVETLPVTMAQYTSGETLRVLPAMNASAVSITLPLIIVIIFFQRYLVKGLAGGAVKG